MLLALITCHVRFTVWKLANETRSSQTLLDTLSSDYYHLFRHFGLLLHDVNLLLCPAHGCFIALSRGARPTSLALTRL